MAKQLEGCQSCEELVGLAKDRLNVPKGSERTIFLCCALWLYPWEKEPDGADNEEWKRRMNQIADTLEYVWWIGPDVDVPAVAECMYDLDHFVIDLCAGKIPQQQLEQLEKDARATNDKSSVIPAKRGPKKSSRKKR